LIAEEESSILRSSQEKAAISGKKDGQGDSDKEPAQEAEPMV